MKFVCWLFHGNDFNREKVVKYSPHHVNALARMLHRHGNHELYCVTDLNPSAGFDSRVAIIPMPKFVSNLPRYYPKLWAFSETFNATIGGPFASIDLDVVILRDLAPLCASAGDFKIWNSAKGEPYNSSFYVMRAARLEVWCSFSVKAAATAARKASRWTGDQSWIAHVLGPNEDTFSELDGLYRLRCKSYRVAPPVGAKAIFFCGPYDPATIEIPWVRRAWDAA